MPCQILLMLFLMLLLVFRKNGSSLKTAFWQLYKKLEHFCYSYEYELVHSQQKHSTHRSVVPFSMFRKNLAYSSNQSAEEELSQPPWSWSAWAQISMTCIQYYLLKRVLSLLRFEYSSGLTSPHPDLIFVTNITNIISGEKLPCGEFSAFHVWHKFFRMTDVEKSEILHIWHVFDEKMSPHMENL